MTVLLLDLDDTLLANDMDRFVPAYLQALSARMAVHAEPQSLIQHLLAATRKMSENQLPDRSLAEVFNAAFYPALGLQQDVVRETIDAFYTQDFPLLRRVTKPKPDAVRLVQEVFNLGYKVGVATNPLFPRTAIEQRLEWAGLAVQEVSFDLVPSYETFHFAKPNLAYYTEFLGQLGWPEGGVVMAGDDAVMDIAPARQLGLGFYWVCSDGLRAWEGGGELPAQGDLNGLLKWLHAEPLEKHEPELSAPDAILAVLRSTPAVFSARCGGLNAEQLTARPAPQEWGVVEVLCHLRDVEIEVNIPRMQRVLAEENPFIPGKDTDAWAETRQYAQQNALDAWREFTSARIELVNMLQSLPAQGWQRTARHAIFGPTRLQELANIIAQHDRVHVRQVHALTRSV
ncbi:MAG: DinB family protein [Anaerolineales bacterium]|nr:DinB family protein [Anaerolineales bacterium]